MHYLYLLFTILFTVYGQIVIKWQMNHAGSLPPETIDKVIFLLRMIINPWIISGFLAAFLAALAWMAAMTKLPLSHAYPFISFSFVLITLSGAIFFHEPLNFPKIFGMIFIVAGIIIGSQG